MRVAWETDLTICNSSIVVNIAREQFRLDLDEVVLQATVDELEAIYNTHDNPYHHFNHAKMVLATGALLMDDYMRVPWTVEERIAFFLALIGHDVGHDGRTNAFHRRKQTGLAVRYHREMNELGVGSVLELHHAHTTVEVVERHGLLMGMDTAQDIVELVRRLIGVTDLAVYQQMRSKSLDKHEWWLDADKRFHVLCLMMQVADLGVYVREWEDIQYWSVRITEERWAQGDEESALGWEVSLFCQRGVHDRMQADYGFACHVIRPLLLECAEWCPAFQDKVDKFERNAERLRVAAEQEKR
jgi:hypothetical protein